MSSIFENFRPGDLLYGMEIVKDGKGYTVAAPRQECRDRLRLNNPALKTCAVTIDELNLNNGIVALLQEFLQVSHDNEQAFFMNHDCPQPIQDHLRFLKSGPHGYDFQRFYVPPRRSDKYISRHICKAVLLKPDVRIHFLLDGLDMERVASKVHYGRVTHDFTAGELRFLYRKWEQNPELREGITFYENGQVVPAPWDPASSHYPLWDRSYKNKRMASSFAEGYQAAQTFGAEGLEQCTAWQSHRGTPGEEVFAAGYARWFQEQRERREASEQRALKRRGRAQLELGLPFGGNDPSSPTAASSVQFFTATPLTPVSQGAGQNPLAFRYARPDDEDSPGESRALKRGRLAPPERKLSSDENGPSSPGAASARFFLATPLTPPVSQEAGQNPLAFHNARPDDEDSPGEFDVPKLTFESDTE